MSKHYSLHSYVSVFSQILCQRNWSEFFLRNSENFAIVATFPSIFLFLLQRSFSRIGFSHQIKTHIVYTSNLLVRSELSNLDAPHNKTKKTPSKLTKNGEKSPQSIVKQIWKGKEKMDRKNKRKIKADKSIRSLVNSFMV